MTDLTADQVVDRCRTYWLGSGVSTEGADEMAAELTAHLAEASADGKSIETVTGDDIDEFAEEWAAAYRGPKPASPAPSTPTSTSLPRTADRAPGWVLWLGALAIVALVVLVAVLAPDDEAMDQAVWVGLWLVAAALLAVGEMLTAGFFLLPFAIGAAAAGILALATVSVPLQIISFVVVSVGSLFLLQRFAQKDIHGELLPVGAARYIGASALVVEPVSRLQNTGWVKMGTEDWRATTDGKDEIPISTEVKVVEVRGARLVVEPVDKP